jgi:ABC-type branched-subunit amino acid transport system ATPase component
MLLEVDGLTAGYGPVPVIHEVGLRLAEGEIVCIIGPNGAGKSTVLRAIAGQIVPAKGNVIFCGENVTHHDTGRKGKDGLIFIPQGNNIFPNLSVHENLEIAGSVLSDKQKLRSGIEHVFQTFSAIRAARTRPARELSGGQRQLLALGRILILRPRLVLLDEPSIGLAPNVVDLIFQEIKGMNKEGISFLLVEQNARKGLSVSNRGYVLELGRNRLTGTGRELLDDTEVKRLYLGG